MLVTSLHGLYTFFSTPYVFTDSEGRIFVILVGRPLDPKWDEVMRGVEVAMTNARRQGLAKGVFKRSDLSHRRGSFAVLGDGVSFGGSQRVSLINFCPMACAEVARP
jgi:hypothetical protein